MLLLVLLLFSAAPLFCSLPQAESQHWTALFHLMSSQTVRVWCGVVCGDLNAQQQDSVLCPLVV